jgi:hypothetical protein
MNKKVSLILGCLLVLAYSFDVHAQKKRTPGAICGDPTKACKDREGFQASDVPFSTPRHAVIFDSVPFYVIVLKSVKLGNFSGCEKIFPEPERLSIQELFPHNKVFASRCSEPGENSYSGMEDNTGFVAVYAGMTLTEAKAFLKKVQATGQFPGIRVRRTRASVNGT